VELSRAVPPGKRPPRAFPIVHPGSRIRLRRPPGLFVFRPAQPRAGRTPFMRCIPSRDDFVALSRTFNLIPVYREIIADTDTPVSALSKLGTGPWAFLLESVEGGETLGRYSFLGNSALWTFRCWNTQVEIASSDGRRVRQTVRDPLALLEERLAAYRPAPVPGLPRFYGGAVGYVGYDAVRFMELLPDGNPHELGTPDMVFLATDAVLIFDHVSRKIQ